MTFEPEPAGVLMDAAIRYTNALAPRLSPHLRDQLVKAMRGGSDFAPLPVVAEVLFAAREEMGNGGRDLLIRITKWGEFLSQQTLRNGRGEAITVAMMRDRAAGKVERRGSDPEIDPRMVEPLSPAPFSALPETEIDAESPAPIV